MSEPMLRRALRSALVVFGVAAAAVAIGTFAIAPGMSAVVRRLPPAWMVGNVELVGIALGLAANSLVALVAGVAVAFLSPTRPVLLALAVSAVLAIVGIVASPVTPEQASMRTVAYLMATGVAMLAAWVTALLLAKRRRT